MPIEINTFKLPMTPSEACSFVQKSTDKLGVFVDLDRCSELIAILQLQNVDIMRKTLEYVPRGTLNLRDKNSVIGALISLGASDQDFKVNVRKPDSFYLNADARARLLANPNFGVKGRELLDLYKTFITNNYNISTLKSFTNYPQTKVLSHNNHRMVRVKPVWTLLNTSRIGSSAPNIQGLSKALCDVFTYPKGYVLLHADSSQIEPRINFSHFIRDDLIVELIKYYNDAYYGILQYCTSTDEELAAMRADFKSAFVPMQNLKELGSVRDTVKTLTNAGSYGSLNLEKVDAKLADAFAKRIRNHPARIALEQKVSEDVRRGVRTFYGAFGTPVTPEDTKNYVRGTESYIRHMIRCGINNPVQTTASELMICGINVVRQLLDEVEDSYLLWYKHDDAGFLVSEKDAEKGYVDKLSEVTAYNVKGWIPIGNEPKVGCKEPVYASYL